MSHGSAHRKRSRRQIDSFGHFASREINTTPVLARATDICFWVTFVATAVCFGGRAAIGQAVLVSGAAATTLCWLLHQLTSPEPKYTWTRSEWLWSAGILVGVCQIVPLPHDWLLAISPRIKEVLPLWFGREAINLAPEGWHQLSLAPWESASGLATFLAYAAMFLVATQRVQTNSSLESMLCGVALAAVAMSVFALVQFLFSNGKFFWFIQHPFMSTDGSPHGSFTNHNHLAQFLSMGTGPLIWWILRPAKHDAESGFDLSSHPLMRVGTVALFLGLAVLVLTVLLTASRGGLLAIGLATIVSLALLCRIGLASARLVIGLCCAGAITGTVFFFTGYQSLASRVDITADGGAKTSGRLEIWLANLQVANEFPILGTGVGTHEDAHQLRLDLANCDGMVFTHAESGYLQVASETGLAGLTVMALMIVTATWWCVVALRNSETQVGAVTVPIFASLLANVCHATFDFFWYTPSCMLMLVIQLACACRLAAQTGEAAGRSTWTWPLPRPLILVGGCGLVAVAVWMTNQKLPAALAEPDYMQYLTLTFQEPPQDKEDLLEQEENRRQAIIRAARKNPHSSRLQAAAGIAYMEMFDARQQQRSENPLPYVQIRDTVIASEFDSEQALHDWLQLAVGRNIKLLQLSRKYFLSALQASPLRVHAYINLVELGFLDWPDPAKDLLYLQQAFKLRPYDPQILFAIGKNVLLTGDQSSALKYLRDAYHRSPRCRDQITNLLVAHVTPEFFLDKFKPDWLALRPLALAFGNEGRSEESRAIWQKCIEDGMARLKMKLPAGERESAVLILRDAYFAIEEPSRAIRVLIEGQKQLPYSISIRTRLGWDLYAAGRYAEAAEHLQWCAARSPNDKGLQEAASRTMKERLKSTASGPSSNPS